VTVFVAVVTDDRETVADAIAPGMGMSPQAFLASPHVLVGNLGQLQERREEYGFSYIAFALDTYEPLSPLVSRLAGT
jgi:hypothetical protein